MVTADTNRKNEIHTSVRDPDSEQFFRPALRGHGLPFRRIRRKRSAYSRHTGYRRRYHHAPAGTFSWTLGVHITKSITIQGQTTVNSDNGTASDLVSMDNLTYNGGSHPFFSVSVPATKPFRMTGITFTAGSRQQTLYNGAITVSGQTDKVRIDHLHFTGPIKHNNYIAIYCRFTVWPIISC